MQINNVPVNNVDPVPVNIVNNANLVPVNDVNSEHLNIDAPPKHTTLLQQLNTIEFDIGQQVKTKVP